MAALVYNASDVTYDPTNTSNEIKVAIADESISAGQPVEPLSTDTTKVVLADLTTNYLPMIALNSAEPGQTVTVLRKGYVKYGTVNKTGKAYYAGTSGSIVEESDLVSGNKIKFLGHFVDSETLHLNPELVTTKP